MSIAAVLSALDVVALASHREGFPLVPLEAAAASVPSLLSDLPIYREILPNYLWSSLVAPGQVEGWSSRLRLLCADADVLRSLGKEQRAALESFDIGQTVAQVSQIYEAALRLEVQRSGQQ